MEEIFTQKFWILFQYTTKLDKGDYTIKLQIRHEKKDLLEKLSEISIAAIIKLPNPISLDVYASHSQALVFGKKLSLAGAVSGKTRLPLYISPIYSEK